MFNARRTHQDEIRDNNTIVVPAGMGKTSFVDVRDIAAVAALALQAGDYTIARLGLASRVTGDVRRLLGRDPISFQQFAEDYKMCWQYSDVIVPA